jgi:NAD+ kinase
VKIRRCLIILKKNDLAPHEGGRTKRDSRMRRLMRERHASVLGIMAQHEEHQASVKIVRRELRARGIEVIERADVPDRPVRDFDLLVSVGGDGTLLEASHVVTGRTLVLGVNSAPAFSVGFLTGCRAPTFAATLDALISGRLKPLEIQRLRVRIGSRVLVEPVINDVLFCADNPAVMTRYRLISPDGEELQRSSGLWISTPAGSTAALRSAGGPTLSLTAKQFAFVVREPYAPPGEGVQMLSGVLERDQQLKVECRSAKASVYLDGHHRRYSVPFGEIVTLSLHIKPLYLVRLRSPLGQSVTV